MTSILREVCRERLNQEWAQADKSLDNYKNVMSKESKLIDEGEIRKNILDKAANKILALPFPEQAVFHLYYAFHLDDSQINEILMIPYAQGMRISMLNYLQKWTSTPEIFACPESISQICTISLTKLMAEINTTEDIQHVYSRRFRKQLRKIHITQQPTDHLLRGILRAAAVFLAISLGFSTAMVTNQINYIPDGYQLVYQSNLPLMKKFRYKNSENTSITIQVSPGNGSNNYNTENSEIKSCMIGEKNVLYWEKDGVRMCVIKEGEWLISVVTELPFNEVFKIVENINYCN
nr:DUF4367 domain-containing protein [Lacrimispora amygdalina]